MRIYPCFYNFIRYFIKFYRVYRITKTNYRFFKFSSRYLFFFFALSPIDNDELQSIFYKKKNDSTLGIHVCMTLNFLMYRRNERKKEGEENRGTHPRVSLSLPPANTIISVSLLPLSLFFSSERLPFFFLFIFFLFSFFTLPSNKEDLPDDDSLPRYYYTPISLMIDTLNLSSWRTGDVAFNYLFPLSLFLFLYSLFFFFLFVFFFFKRS